MGSIQTSLWLKDIPLESDQSFILQQSALYTTRLQKFAGAIVPKDVYYDPQYQVVNAYLPVDIDVSQSHKVGWSAKRHTDAEVLTPEMLEVYIVLTFFGKIPKERPIHRNGTPVTGEQELYHILFPGSWAILLWQKWLCLWYQTRQVLRRNPLYPQGLIQVAHQNLTEVFEESMYNVS